MKIGGWSLRFFIRIQGVFNFCQSVLKVIYSNIIKIDFRFRERKNWNKYFFKTKSNIKIHNVNSKKINILIAKFQGCFQTGGVNFKEF